MCFLEVMGFDFRHTRGLVLLALLNVDVYEGEHRCVPTQFLKAVVRLEDILSEKWLRDHGFVSSVRRINAAVEAGNLDLVRFLLDPGDTNCTSEAVSNATGSEVMELVRFLYDMFGIESCSATSSMNCAAANGHLDIVRLLHENLNEGCSSAFSIAVRLEIVHLELARFYATRGLSTCID